MIKSFEELEIYGFDGGGSEIFYYQNQPFTGILEYRENGILYGETEYKDGYKEGVHRLYYYPSGNIEIEYYKIDNKLEGEAKQWDENGNLIKVSKYVCGKKISS